MGVTWLSLRLVKFGALVLLGADVGLVHNAGGQVGFDEALCVALAFGA